MVDDPVDRGGEAEDVLEQRGRAGALAGGPRQAVVELVERAGQSEEFEVSPEPGEDGVVVAWSAIWLFGRVLPLGLAMLSSPVCATATRR